jgi:hypothetical protein
MHTSELDFQKKKIIICKKTKVGKHTLTVFDATLEDDMEYSLPRRKGELGADLLIKCEVENGTKGGKSPEKEAVRALDDFSSCASSAS